MLKHISLHTINQVFDVETLMPISSKAKVAYLQCLTYHFTDMEPSYVNLSSFDIMKSVVNQKSMPTFQELEKAGLVEIKEHTITFLNHWKKYIDKTGFARISADEYMAMNGYTRAIEFKEEILKNKSFYELIQIQCKISEQKTTELINLFFATQGAYEQSYPNYPAASRHCMNWIRSQTTNTTPYKQQTIIKNNAVKQIEFGKQAGSL